MLQLDGSYKFKPGTLTHSKIIGGRFGSDTFGRVDWSVFIATVLALGFERLRREHGDRQNAVDDLAKRTGFKFRDAAAKNFKAIQDAGLWFQRQDVHDVWLAAVEMAKLLGVDFELTVWWPSKPDAAHPGERARITYRTVTLSELLA